MLETAPGVAITEARLLAWRDSTLAVRRHSTGAALAFAAPIDQLYAATEVNEWAWHRACEPPAVSNGNESTVWDADANRLSIRAMAFGERRPAALALMAAAKQRQCPAYFDDEMFRLEPIEDPFGQRLSHMSEG